MFLGFGEVKVVVKDGVVVFWVVDCFGVLVEGWEGCFVGVVGGFFVLVVGCEERIFF